MTFEEREQLKQEILEHVYLKIPEMVTTYTSEYKGIKELREKFYKENSDLVNHSYLVSTTINRLVAENPEWDIATQVLQEAARQVRESLSKVNQESPKGFEGVLD